MFELPPLTQRPTELMDDPSLEAHQHQQALRALARIHFFSRTVTHIVRQVVSLLGDRTDTRSESLRILDIACGGGELTAAVARRLAAKTSCRVEVIGLDISERAIHWATRKHATTTKNLIISFRACNVLTDELPSCTLAFHSLFLHHLDNAQAVAQLRSMASATDIGFVFSDLLRTRIGLLLAQLGTRLLSRSAVAQIDGPLSVRAARTVDEYHDLFRAAHLSEPILQRVWPERVCITWRHK